MLFSFLSFSDFECLLRFRALSNSITSTMNLSLQKAMGLPRLTLLRKNPSDASLFMVLDAKWANWAACSRERSGGNRGSFLNAASTSSRDRGLRLGNRLGPRGCPSCAPYCGFMFFSSTVILIQPGHHCKHRAPENLIAAGISGLSSYEALPTGLDASFDGFSTASFFGLPGGLGLSSFCSGF